MTPEQWNTMSDAEKTHYIRHVGEIVNRRLDPITQGKPLTPSIPNIFAAALFLFPAMSLITQELAWLWGVPITIILAAAAYFPSKSKHP